jgi:hypothetical protein
MGYGGGIELLRRQPAHLVVDHRQQRTGGARVACSMACRIWFTSLISVSITASETASKQVEHPGTREPQSFDARGEAMVGQGRQQVPEVLSSREFATHIRPISIWHEIK